MVQPFRRLALLLALLGSLGLGGCVPSGDSRGDEEKEPHYLAGKSRVSGRDYRGAIEAFERALEVNPRSAAAHFQLGWIYCEKENQPATAIYHYERFLQLRPQAENADIVQQHILRLKQDLAKAVLPLPTTPDIQQRFEQLASENRRLKEEVEQLRAALSRAALPANTPTTASSARSIPSSSSQAALATTAPASPIMRPASNRTHRVESGETPFSIARRYRVSVDALLGANPGLNPRRLQVGQILNIPTS